MITVVVTGGRNYRMSDDDKEALSSFLYSKSDRFRWGSSDIFDVTLRHGDCGGVDRSAAKVADGCICKVEAFPADWAKYGRRAGPIRNRKMVDGADVLVAFPGGRGTRDCCIAAVDARVPIVFMGKK